MKLKNKILLALALLIFLAGVAAQCAPQIKILNKTSKVFHDWDDGIDLIPDATMVYRITFQNGGTEPAKGVVIKDEIPSNTTFVLKSVKASGAIKIEYYDRIAGVWTDKAPANPTKVQSLRATFEKNIAPAKNNKQVEWLEYAVKVNY
jgi:uncharacterized repeat protein (TIGR01451 family)